MTFVGDMARVHDSRNRVIRYELRLGLRKRREARVLWNWATVALRRMLAVKMMPGPGAKSPGLAGPSCALLLAFLRFAELLSSCCRVHAAALKCSVPVLKQHRAGAPIWGRAQIPPRL